ncbi:THO complex subunit 5, partial [Podochytrium sp. JEL0797]
MAGSPLAPPGVAAPSASQTHEVHTSSTTASTSKYARPAQLQAPVPKATPPPLQQQQHQLHPLQLHPHTDPASAADAAFLALLTTQRKTLAASRTAKQQTTTTKQSLDTAVLKEKNLMYERDHLRREIAKARAFGYIYHDIQLHPIDHFTALQAEAAAKHANSKQEDTAMVIVLDKEEGEDEESSDPMLVSAESLDDVDRFDKAWIHHNNDHELMLNRLQFELCERKRLKKNQDALQTIKQRLLQQNESKKQALESLDKDLETFLKASIPLQERLGVSVTKKRVEMGRAQMLKRPLFVLYQEVVDWNELRP